MVGECFPRHGHQDLLQILGRLDHEFRGAQELHLMAGNYAKHRHPR